MQDKYLKRRDFNKIVLSLNGGLLLTPFNSLSWLDTTQKETSKIEDYTLKKSSLSVSRLLLNEIKRPPKEFKQDFTKIDQMSQEDLNKSFIKKINDFDQSLINHNKTLFKDFEYGKISDKLIDIASVGAVGLAVSLLVPHAALSIFIADAVGGGMLYEVFNLMANGVGEPENKEQLDKSIQDLKQSFEDQSKEIKTSISKNKTQIQQLQKQNDKASERLEKEAGKNREKLKMLSNQVSKNAKKLDKVQTQVDNVKKTTDVTQSMVRANSLKLDENKQAIIQTGQKVIEIVGGKVDTIGKYIFLNLPPKLQQQAIEDDQLGFLKNLSPDAKKGLRKEVNENVKKQEFNEWYRGFSDSLKTANKLMGEAFVAAKALGLKGKDAIRVQRVLGWANQVTNIALSFASSNPVGYVSGALQVIGLFGKKSKGQQEVFEQLFKKLDAIHDDMIKGFTDLDKKLDRLAELNIELFEKLQSIIERQTQFQQKWFKYLAEQTKEIKEEIIISREQNLVSLELLKDRLFDDIDNLEVDDKLITKLNLNLSRFKDYVLVRDMTGFSDSLKQLFKIVKGTLRGYEVYFIPPLSKQKKGVFPLSYFQAEYMYSPLRKLFNELYPSESTRKIALNALLFPTEQVNKNFLSYELIQDDIMNQKGFTPQLREKYLSPRKIYKVVSWYTRYCHFYELKKDDTFNPCSLEEYLNLDDEIKTNRLKRINLYLKSLLKLVDEAYIQQTIMSGHLLLDKIDILLMHRSNQSLFKNVRDALRSNYLVSQNFITYLLYGRLYISDTDYNNFIHYQKSYEEKDIEQLQSYMGGYEVTYENNIFFANLNGVKIAMPSGEQIKQNKMMYPSELELLKSAKQKIIAKMQDIGFGGIFK